MIGQTHKQTNKQTNKKPNIDYNFIYIDTPLLVHMYSKYSKGDQYCNLANLPPRVAAFSLLQSKKYFLKYLRLRIDDLVSEKSPLG